MTIERGLEGGGADWEDKGKKESDRDNDREGRCETTTRGREGGRERKKE